MVKNMRGKLIEWTGETIARMIILGLVITLIMGVWYEACPLLNVCGVYFSH